VREVIRLIAISLFLAPTLIPIVDAVERRARLPRAVIILSVYLVLIAGVVLVGVVVVPSVVKEVQQLSHDAPRYAHDLRANAAFRHYDDRYHISAKLVNDARQLPQALAHLAGPLKQITVQAFSLIGQLVTVMAITFLLILHGREYVSLGLSLTGARQERYRRLIYDIGHAVAMYMLGNVVISVLATLATWIVLSILGVPYALSLGFVVGFFDLIPLVGATLGAIVVSLATVSVSFPVATLVWIAFIIVWQRFEDYVVQPLVYGRALKVNPLVTIVAVLAGASLLGLLGALIAIPSAAAVQIVLRDCGPRAAMPSRLSPGCNERVCALRSTVLKSDSALRHDGEITHHIGATHVTERPTRERSPVQHLARYAHSLPGRDRGVQR
jgi:predicted PurR-regulated permease PerM